MMALLVVAAAGPARVWPLTGLCDANQVYIDSGHPAVPPLRRCKLAVLCAVLHLEDEPYARCIGSAEEEGRDVESD